MPLEMMRQFSIRAREGERGFSASVCVRERANNVARLKVPDGLSRIDFSQVYRYPLCSQFSRLYDVFRERNRYSYFFYETKGQFQIFYDVYTK